MATVNGYTYRPTDTSTACMDCKFETYKSWGEYDFPIIGSCPDCGGKLVTRKIYICPTCQKDCFGVDDLRWHIGYHG